MELKSLSNCYENEFQLRTLINFTIFLISQCHALIIGSHATLEDGIYILFTFLKIT